MSPFLVVNTMNAISNDDDFTVLFGGNYINFLTLGRK